MMFTSRSFLVAGLAVGLLGALTTGSASGQTITVIGFVQDGNNPPNKLGNAKILAVDGKGKAISQVATSSSAAATLGQYAVVVDVTGLTRSTLLYWHDDWQLQRVPALAATNLFPFQPQVPKVLPDPNGPRDYLDILDQIDTYQYLYDFAVGAKQKDFTPETVVKAFQANVRLIPNPFALAKQGPKQKLAMEQLKDQPERKAVIAAKLAALYKTYGITDLPTGEEKPSLICPTQYIEICPPPPRCRLFRRR